MGKRIFTEVTKVVTERKGCGKGVDVRILTLSSKKTGNFDVVPVNDVAKLGNSCDKFWKKQNIKSGFFGGLIGLALGVGGTLLTKKRKEKDEDDNEDDDFDVE